VALVARLELGAVEPERLRRVRVVRRVQRLVQAVDGRSVVVRLEARLARRVRGLRVRREVVIERDVLLEDHDHVADRRRGPAAARRVVPARVGARRHGQHGGRGDDREREDPDSGAAPADAAHGSSSVEQP
jgi:hypothetical protein